MGDRDYMRDNYGAGGGGFGGPRTWTAVKVLLFINLGVFVLQHFIFRSGAPFWHPDGSPAGGVSVPGLKDGEVLGLLTYMFVHSGFQAGGLAFLHILGNMLILFFIGRRVEAMIGRMWLYIMYVGGGLAGAGLELMLSSNTYIIGASGATMAILLAFTTSEPERRIMMLIPLPVEIKLRTLGRLVLGLSLVLGVVAKLSGPSADGVGSLVLNVAHFAHLGGAVFGLLLMRKVRPETKSRYEMSTGDILRGVGRPETKKKASGFMQWWAKGGRKKPPVVQPRDKGLDEREYDEILDKVNKCGIHGLTESERQKLVEASERMKARERRGDG